jgi:hypothetical protein
VKDIYEFAYGGKAKLATSGRRQRTALIDGHTHEKDCVAAFHGNAAGGMRMVGGPVRSAMREYINHGRPGR